MRPVLIAFSLAAASTAWAQNPNVVLKLGSTTMEVGEVVDAQLVCTNTGRPDPPIVGPTVGYEWKLVNPVPSRFSQQSWVNGRRTSQETYTYRLRVTARKVGRFAVGPIALPHRGLPSSTKLVASLTLPNDLNATPTLHQSAFAPGHISA